MSTAVVALALVDPGYFRTDVELHDSGVWVTRSTDSQLGRFNYEAQTIDGMVVGGSSEIDVMQDGSLVLMSDPVGGTVTLVDPASVEPSGSVTLPESAEIALGGPSVAVWEPAGGSVWVLPASEVLAFDAEETPAAVEIGAGADVAVAVDGTVLVADPTTMTLSTVPVDEAGRPRPTRSRSLDGVVGDVLHVTAVGTDAVVLDVTAGQLLLPDGHVAVEEADEVVLQEPGPDSNQVALAGPNGLRLQPMNGDAADVIAASGGAVAPVRVGACLYGAWSSGSVVRVCGDEDPYVGTVPATSGDLRYRVNRGYVVLNDLATGTVWLADQDYLQRDDWDDLAPSEDPSAEETDQAATEVEQILAERDLPNRPPTAEDDTIGVRAGRTAILTVLDNDTDPDGDILRATPDGDPSFGAAQSVLHGAAIQVAVPDDAAGSATFDYTVDDGREGTDTATVTLEVHGEDVNGPPERIRPTEVQVEQGDSVDVDVLGDWRDPDGDALQLVGAAATTTGDDVRFTADGGLTFIDGGNETGVKSVMIRVSDGRETTEGTIDVEVMPRGQNLPPAAGVDHVSAVAGREINISPLDNDTDPNGDVLRLARVDDEAGVTVDRNLDAGTLTFTAAVAGVYYLNYLVTDGPSASVGLIRVDVGPADADDQPPVAVRDRALLPTDGSVLVDVLANDTDPGGNVLVLQSVDVDPGAGVAVAVLDHAMLRITAVQMGTSPVALRYTVSNGLSSSQGEVLVIPVEPPGESQSPQAVEDEATVRAGDVVTIDVLKNDSHPDGLPLSVEPELVEPPDASAGLMFVSEDAVRFQAGPEEQTVYATYAVRDPQGHKDSAQITVHVVALDPERNSAPVPATVTARLVSGERTRIAIPLDGIDPDGDSVELEGISRAPHLGRITAIGDGWVEYESSRGASGTDSFSYVATDRFGATGEGVVVVGIAPAGAVNQQPIAVVDTRVVQPNREITVPVLDNDVDPEGDVLGLTDDLESSDNLDVQAVDGRLVVRAPAQEGDYVVRYGVTDGVTAAVTGVLQLTVSADAPQMPPVARDDRLTLADVVGRASVEVPVLENDDDPDGSRSTLTVSTSVVGVAVSSGGHLVVPVLAEAQLVAYTITDEDGLSASAFVRVPGVGAPRPTLRPGLAPLEAVAGAELVIDLADYVVVGEGRTVRLTQAEKVLGLRGEAVAVDEDTLSFLADAQYYGPAAVTFEVIDTPTVDDPTGRTAVLSISIDVTPAGPVPPELAGLAVDAPLGTETAVSLSRYAFDPNGDPVTFRVADVPDGLSASVDGSTLQVEPDGGTPVGTKLAFSLVASDGTSETRATATVTVTSSNAPLTTVVDDVIADADAGQTYTVPVLDNDYSSIDGELSVVATVLEAGEGDVDTDGSTVTVTPAAGFAGTMVVAYTVADATGDPARQVIGRVRLTVRDVPDAPGTPTVVEVRSHTAVISWAPPNTNGAEITRYEVTVNGAGGGTRTCPSTTCTIEGLTNDQPYTFQVVAVNEVGPSEKSPQSAEIRPDAIPDPPAAPVLTFGDGSLTVDWTNRDYGGERSAIVSVDLEISPPPASGVAQQTQVRGTSTQWSGLENGTAYQVRVRAVNGAGASEWSTYSASEIPAGVPDAPGQPATSMLAPVGSQAQMLVSWTAPASDHGDAVKGYTLQVFHGGATPVQVLELGPVLSQAVTVDTSETPYTYQVVATNKAGPSAASAASAPRQAVVPPGPVTNLVAQAADRAITLTFVDAARNGASAGQMAYQYALNGGGWSALAGTRQITGLANGTAYSVQVRAVSTVDGAQYTGPAQGAGYTGTNTSASGVTPYGAPVVPSVSATSGATTVSLAASTASNGCGVTLHFRVDGGGWQTAASTWSGAVGNGYNQSHSIEAYSTDSCGQTSATASTSASSGPPPMSASVSKGPAVDCATGASGGSCNMVRLNTSNFPAGNYRVACWSDEGGAGVWFTNNSVPVPASGYTDVIGCWYGYPNSSVRLEIIGTYTTPWVLWKNA